MEENKDNVTEEVKEQTPIETKEEVKTDNITSGKTEEIAVNGEDEKKGISEEDLKEDNTEKEMNPKLKKLPYILIILIIIGTAVCVVETMYLKGYFTTKTTVKKETKEDKGINRYNGTSDTMKDEYIAGKTLRCTYEGNVSDMNDPSSYDIFFGYEEYFNYKVDYTFLLADESNEIERVRIKYTYYYLGNVSETVDETNSDSENTGVSLEDDDIYQKVKSGTGSLCSSGYITYPSYNCSLDVDGKEFYVEYKISNDSLIKNKTIIADGLTFSKKMEFSVLINAFQKDGPNGKSYVCIEE